MVTQIKLSTKSFGRDAAEVASQAIANVSQSLVDVDMSDVIAGRPEAEALDALRIMSNALSRLQLRCGPKPSRTLSAGVVLCNVQLALLTKMLLNLCSATAYLLLFTGNMLARGSTVISLCSTKDAELISSCGHFLLV